MSIVTRTATLGLVLALFAGVDVPGMVHAQNAGRVLVMGSIAEPDTFVGGEGGLYGTAVVGNLIYGQPGLVGIDDLMRPEAELATDVPTLDNGEAVMVGDAAAQHLETTFHLRQNATFSDGTPVTADDVVFSWKQSLNPNWPAQAGNDLESKYSDVVAVDPHTVVFKMKPSVIHPFYPYGLPDVWIYPSRRLDSLVDFDPQNSPKVANLQSSVYARQPVGSGPYVLDSWDPGLQMVLHARSGYYRGKPAIDIIIIRGFGASKQTLIDQLQAGDVQTLGSDTVDVSDVDTINAIPGVTAYVRASTTIEHLAFYLLNPILADKQVRHAIAYAIDRQDLVNRVLAGHSSAADSWIPPISQFFTYRNWGALVVEAQLLSSRVDTDAIWARRPAVSVQDRATRPCCWSRTNWRRSGSRSTSTNARRF